MPYFNYKKAIQALNFFAIKENGTINKMKAIKLIWLSDRAHLRKYGRPILNDRYYAMEYGPVPSNTKDLCECDNTFIGQKEQEERDEFIFPHHDNMNYDSKKDVDTDYFSETDLAIMEDIYTNFGKFDQYQLAKKISHEYPEWKKHEQSLVFNSRIEIDYEDFFENTDKKNDYFNNIDSEHLEISKSIYKESKLLI